MIIEGQIFGSFVNANPTKNNIKLTIYLFLVYFGGAWTYFGTLLANGINMIKMITFCIRINTFSP